MAAPSPSDQEEPRPKAKKAKTEDRGDLPKALADINAAGDLRSDSLRKWKSAFGLKDPAPNAGLKAAAPEHLARCVPLHQVRDQVQNHWDNLSSTESIVVCRGKRLHSKKPNQALHAVDEFVHELAQLDRRTETRAVGPDGEINVGPYLLCGLRRCVPTGAGARGSRDEFGPACHRDYAGETGWRTCPDCTAIVARIRNGAINVLLALFLLAHSDSDVMPILDELAEFLHWHASKVTYFNRGWYENQIVAWSDAIADRVISAHTEAADAVSARLEAATREVRLYRAGHAEAALPAQLPR
jgi:hypothetical protein